MLPAFPSEIDPDPAEIGIMPPIVEPLASTITLKPLSGPIGLCVLGGADEQPFHADLFQSYASFPPR